MAPSHFADIEEIPSTADCGPVSAVVHRYTVLVGSAVGFRAHPVCVHDVPAWGPPLILPLLGHVITPRPPRSPCTWNKHAGATFNIITCSLKDLYLRFEFNFNRERDRDRQTQRERGDIIVTLVVVEEIHSLWEPAVFCGAFNFQ